MNIRQALLIVLFLEGNTLCEDMLVEGHGVELLFHQDLFTAIEAFENVALVDESSEFVNALFELFVFLVHAVEVGLCCVVVHDMMIEYWF